MRKFQSESGSWHDSPQTEAQKRSYPFSSDGDGKVDRFGVEVDETAKTVHDKMDEIHELIVAGTPWKVAGRCEMCEARMVPRRHVVHLRTYLCNDCMVELFVELIQDIVVAGRAATLIHKKLNPNG